MNPLSYPRVVMLRLGFSWTRWLQKRKLKRLVREQHRLQMLEDLTKEQAVKVGRLILDQQQLRQERQMFLEEPVEPPPPTPPPPPPFRATPAILQEEPEEMPDPMQELSQRLGLPPQPS